MGSDLIEAKIGFWGFSLDLIELFRRLRGKRPTSDDGIAIVAQRFRALLAGHELKLQHAIDIFPPEFGIRLEQLSTDEKILSFLSPQVLDWTAQYFGVRRDWLDGSVPYIYESRRYTKNLRGAVDDAVELTKHDSLLEGFLLVDTNNHDFRSGQSRYGCFVMRARVTDLNHEHSLYRYVVCTEAWPLSENYLSQLKVMGRLLYKYFGMTIPIMQVTPTELEAAYAGTVFLASLIKPPLLREFHLEDFALRPEESAKAQDPSFAEYAIQYLKESGLNEYAETNLEENGLTRAELPGGGCRVSPLI